MSEGNLTNTMASKILDWPFLFFVLVLLILYKFRVEISLWMRGVTEFEISKGTIKFKIGKDEVSLDKLDATLTARLRELQEEIEALRNTGNASRNLLAPPEGERGEIPAGMETLLVERVYPMLTSKLWLGRYVETLAKAAAVSEELMLKFCRSRGDIGLFKDGDRWVAALSERLK